MSVALYVLLHIVKVVKPKKIVFTKILKDVGIEMAKSIETSSKCSMHAGDDSIQQS